jgi:hypothetical protein
MGYMQYLEIIQMDFGIFTMVPTVGAGSPKAMV